MKLTSPTRALESVAMLSTDPRLFFGQGAYITLSTTEMRDNGDKLDRHGLENQYHDVQPVPQDGVRSPPSPSSRTTGDDESVPVEAAELEDIDDFFRRQCPARAEGERGRVVQMNVFLLRSNEALVRL